MKLHVRAPRIVGRVAALASIPQNAICAEIGVWKGDFSQQVLDRCRPKELHLIDPWAFACEYPQRWYGGAQAINQNEMDRIAADVIKRFAGRAEVYVHRLRSVDAASEFPESFFDWVYIDGNHSTEFVLGDLHAWLPKTKVGGKIWLDDYNWTDEKGVFSVRAAVQRFLSQKPWLSGRERDGQYEIRISSAPGISTKENSTPP